MGTTQIRALDYTYDALGNLLSKASSVSTDIDVTNYGYGTTTNAGPHAVSLAAIEGLGLTVNYDPNGNVTAIDTALGDDKFFVWNSPMSFNDPTCYKGCEHAGLACEAVDLIRTILEGANVSIFGLSISSLFGEGSGGSGSGSSLLSNFGNGIPGMEVLGSHDGAGLHSIGILPSRAGGGRSGNGSAPSLSKLSRRSVNRSCGSLVHYDDDR